MSLAIDTPLSTRSPSRARSIISSLLFLHCAAIAVVFSANLAPSDLQLFLVRGLAPYTRVLNFDPNFTRYYLYHGEPPDDDHVLEYAVSSGPVDASAGAPSESPQFLRLEQGWRGSDRRHRYFELAGTIAFLLEANREEAVAEIVRSVGASLLHDHQAQRLTLRCVWLQPRLMTDPAADAIRETIYEAEVWRASDGGAYLIRRAPSAEVAPLRHEGARAENQ